MLFFLPNLLGSRQYRDGIGLHFLITYGLGQVYKLEEDTEGFSWGRRRLRDPTWSGWARGARLCGLPRRADPERSEAEEHFVDRAAGHRQLRGAFRQTCVPAAAQKFAGCFQINFEGAEDFAFLAAPREAPTAFPPALLGLFL